MRAEILSTGDEVLWGDIDDTNSSWLSRKLREYDIEIVRISCVGDHLEDIAGIMKEISVRGSSVWADSVQVVDYSQTDIVLVTGGLGPTSDDLSAEAAALASDDTIIMNQIALNSMKSYFSKRNWNLSDDNIKQAMLPSRAGVMENLHGTAPGFYIEIDKTIFFFMPGVPREMKPMFEQSVLPIIKDRFFKDQSDANNSKQMLTRFKLFGLPESKVGSRLKGFNQKFPKLKLGFRASIPIIEVKFSGRESELNGADKELFATNISSIHKQMSDAAKWISSRLEDYIFSYTGLNMEQELGRLLALKKKTVAVAESCTGGLIGSMFTDVAGSSDYFLLSAVTYSNDAKINILGVNPETLLQYGAVHEETAKEMALGVMRVAGADYGVATSGIAGPGGGSDEKPVGTVCIGVASRGVNGEIFAKSKRYLFTYGDRTMNKKMFAVKAMDMLRREVVLIN
ncbi:MAG: CinA family nicotinamide mononucleotide deamidase-related protein [Desulfamplus sp.]|nr:CinA family nicotinamide mononucleotide deamidase-related protein [Desulfamplus sp.]